MLKRSRWLLLKRPEKLTGEQRGRLAELVRRNLRTVRAYLLKEDFQSLWGYVSPYLGRPVPRPLVHPDDALAPRPDSELVPSPGAVLQWRCRRLQRKGQSDHQTGVWVPHLRGTGSRFVSRTWRPARTKTHPQILLTRPKLSGCDSVVSPACERRVVGATKAWDAWIPRFDTARWEHGWVTGACRAPSIAWAGAGRVAYVTRRRSWSAVSASTPEHAVAHHL